MLFVIAMNPLAASLFLGFVFLSWLFEIWFVMPLCRGRYAFACFISVFDFKVPVFRLIYSEACVNCGCVIVEADLSLFVASGCLVSSYILVYFISLNCGLRCFLFNCVAFLSTRSFVNLFLLDCVLFHWLLWWSEVFWITYCGYVLPAFCWTVW